MPLCVLLRDCLPRGRGCDLVRERMGLIASAACVRRRTDVKAETPTSRLCDSHDTHGRRTWPPYTMFIYGFWGGVGETSYINVEQAGRQVR